MMAYLQAETYSCWSSSSS